MTYEFGLILTFQEMEQQFGDVKFEEAPSEAEFLFEVLSGLSKEERQQLRKISACQGFVGPNLENLMGWLEVGEGKWYFELAEKGGGR